MAETLFEHYLLGGGWAMFVLVPASVVALGTTLRAVTILWGSAPHRVASEVRATVAAQRRQGALSLADARVIAMDAAMRIYLVLQPLVLIFLVAPLVGALGTAMALNKAWRGAVSLQARNLAEALERAFIPLCWGLGVALLSVAAYAILKARLATLEREVLAPAAIAALSEPLERVPGDRKV